MALQATCVFSMRIFLLDAATGSNGPDNQFNESGVSQFHQTYGSVLVVLTYQYANKLLEITAANTHGTFGLTIAPCVQCTYCSSLCAKQKTISMHKKLHAHAMQIQWLCCSSDLKAKVLQF